MDGPKHPQLQITNVKRALYITGFVSDNHSTRLTKKCPSCSPTNNRRVFARNSLSDHSRALSRIGMIRLTSTLLLTVFELSNTLSSIESIIRLLVVPKLGL
jgi:hypothetical protein